MSVLKKVSCTDNRDTTINLLAQSLSVNGQYEFEISWSLFKRLATIPLLAWVYMETLFITVFVLFYNLFLPRTAVFRKDTRLWPAALLYYLSSGAMFAKRNSMKWQAIEYIYNWEQQHRNLPWYDRVLSRFWGSFENVVATRNRFRNLKRELFWEIESLLAKDSPIRVVSLAAGSARGPIEILGYFLARGQTSLDRVEIHLVDNDPDAYEFAQQLASGVFPGLEGRITYHRAKISSRQEGLAELGTLLRSISPNIVEMVGFGDYLSQDKALKIFSAIYSSIPDRTLFITNNVAPNIEQKFLELVVSWRMVNRDEKDVLSLLHGVGFQKARTVWEPTAIQTVYVSRK